MDKENVTHIHNSKPLQGSCLENPMDRGTQQATVQRGYKESDTTEWVNNNNNILLYIVAVWIYIPTNSARGFPFLHTLSSIYYL